MSFSLNAMNIVVMDITMVVFGLNYLFAVIYYKWPEKCDYIPPVSIHSFKYEWFWPSLFRQKIEDYVQALAKYYI